MNRIKNYFNRFHPMVNLLFIGSAMSRIATSMSIPFLTIYLTLNTDTNPLLIGIIVGSGPLTTTLVGFLGGSLSDRIGRTVCMLASLYIWALVFVGFAFTSNIWILLLLNILNGGCKAFFEPASKALMSDLTEKELRYKMFSLQYTAINLGVVIGPLLGGLIGIAAGPIPFLITGIFYFAYGLMIQILLKRMDLSIHQSSSENVKEVQSIQDIFKVMIRDHSLLLFLVGGVLIQFVYSQVATLSQHLTLNFADGVTIFAILMSTNALVVVIFQMPVSTWAEKQSPLKAIAYGNILYAIGAVGFAFSNSLIFFIVSMVIFTLGEAICFPASTVLIDKIAPDHMRGSYFGAHNFTELGRFLGPTLGLFAYATVAVLPTFLGIALISLVCNIFFWIGLRLYSKRSAVPVGYSA